MFTLPACMGLVTLDYTGDPCSRGLVRTRIARIWTASVLIGVELVSTQATGRGASSGGQRLSQSVT